MKDVTSARVREILRKSGGLRSIGCRAVATLRRKTLPINILFSLGNELQSRGLSLIHI